MTAALDRVRALLGDRFEQLAGMHVSGELPLSDAVANRAIAERLAGASGPVAAVQVHARDGDALDVELTLRGVPLISTVPVSLKIDQQPTLPASPLLRLQWSLAGLGALARLAAPFVARAKGLPPGVRIEGDHVVVDVAEPLRAQGLADLLQAVTRLEVHTREGRIVVMFEFAIRDS